MKGKLQDNNGTISLMTLVTRVLLQGAKCSHSSYHISHLNVSAVIVLGYTPLRYINHNLAFLRYYDLMILLSINKW